MRWTCAAALFCLSACAHQAPVEIPIEIPVPCLRAPVVEPTPEADRVTDERLKRAPTAKYPLLAGLRIEQDRKTIKVLRAAVDVCAKLPARPDPLR